MCNGVTRTSSHIGRQAIVIGAGISGLAAARALADHFEEVVVFERDEFPSGATARPGAPQGKQAHGLLGGAMKALEELFPDFARDLVQAGAFAGQSRLRTFAGISWHGSLSTAGVGLAYLLAEPATDRTDYAAAGGAARQHHVARGMPCS
jgi:phytoene dehydrogenase-like protein